MIVSKATALETIDSFKALDAEDHNMKEKTQRFVEEREKSWGKEIVEGHLTGSALVVNTDRTKVLLVHHKKLNKWLQPGGHVDDDDADIAAAAVREAKEETGLSSPKLVSSQPIDIDVHPIPETPKAKRHYHYDIRFLVEADGNEPLLCSHESNDVKWFGVKEAIEQSESSSLTRLLAKL